MGRGFENLLEGRGFSLLMNWEFGREIERKTVRQRKMVNYFGTHAFFEIETRKTGYGVNAVGVATSKQGRRAQDGTYFLTLVYLHL